MFEEERANDLWLEDAYENFDQAVRVGDIPTARIIILDTADAGFITESNRMRRQLRMHLEEQTV